MTRTSTAMVLTAPEQLELREFPIPRIGPNDGLLRVERCGICGSDVEQVRGDLTWVPYPVIPGHEPVGTIEEVGEDAARRWGVQPGDRVVLEGPVPCRSCAACAAGRYSLCPNHIGIGFTSLDVAPGLFGGYSEYLYLHPNTTMHRIDPSVPLDVAPMFNPLACGVGWVAHAGGVQLGDVVLVMGAGQRGIACGIVAKAVGAETVIMTGLSADAHKLAVARELGIDATVDVEREDLREILPSLTGGRQPDVVIDVVPNAAHTVTEAVDLVRTEGTIVLAGMKGDVAVPDLFTDQIALRAITLKGVRGKTSRAYELAVGILESGRFPMEKLQPRSYPLARARDAVDALAGADPTDRPICVSIAPGSS